MASTTTTTTAPAELVRTPFGKPMRAWFPLAPTYRNLNHGSFGTAPSPVHDARAAFNAASEARPDVFQRTQLGQSQLDARTAAAKLLRAPVETVVLVPNTTTAVNVVLRNIVWQPGDRVLYFADIYPACYKTLLSVCEAIPDLQPLPMGLDYSGPRGTSDADVVALLEKTVRDARTRGENPRMCIFDTVVSFPGVRLPFQALAAKCRELGVLSLVDGAHGAGLLELDLSALDPDFFVTNTHKWLFVPRSCAAFYVPKRNQHLIRTSLPTGHGWEPAAVDEDEGPIRNPLDPGPGEESLFARNFKHAGTVDWTQCLCIPAALEFREKVCGGEAAIYEYCNTLAHKGGQRVAEILGSRVMNNDEGTLLRDNPMVMVEIPLDVAAANLGEKGLDGVGRWMQSRCMDEYETFLMIIAYHGRLWTRLSAQVYLDMDDFEFAGQTIKALCERANACEHLIK